VLTMKLKSAIAKYTIACGVFATGLFTGCQPEEFEGGGNGIVSPELDASFTVTPVTVEGKINTFVFSANHTKDVLSVKWDMGDGNAIFGPAKTDVVFFPDKDPYKIVMHAVGKGGKIFTSEQVLQIENSDPKAGNLLKGGKLNNGDQTNWQVLTYSAGVAPVFEAGKVIFKGGSGGHAGIFQPVQVVAGQKYKIDMSVTGSGATDTWFEVYIGTVVPESGAGKDYNSGGNRLALNTWANCGKASFNDKLTKLACAGSLQGTVGGIVQFDNSGTYYVVIRTGGANLGTTGIAVDNIELRPAQ
jgi:hypothetical protein